MRGHSYSQCDRNFGIYGKKLKMESVYSKEEYVQVLQKCREKPQPFQVGDGSEIIKDWKTNLMDFFFPKPKGKYPFQLQSYVRMQFGRDGTISASKTCQSFHAFFIDKQNKILPKNISFFGPIENQL